MRCKYGENCKRNKPEHLKELCHPCDWDWEPEGDEASDLEDNMCARDKEEEADIVEDVVEPCPEKALAYPDYWVLEHNADAEREVGYHNATDEIVAGIQDLLTKTFKNVKTSDRKSPLPRRVLVENVKRVENCPLWRKYAEHKWRMGKKRRYKCTPFERVAGDGCRMDMSDSPLKRELADKVNEMYLWHGCAEQAAIAITGQDGFLMKYCGTGAGSMYGPGIYLAECSSKADEYSEVDGYGDAYILLCRAHMGEVLKMTQGGNATHAMIEAAVGSGAYDSVLGDREASVGTYREFIFYEEGQVYPEYLVRYKRDFSPPTPPPLPDEVLPEKIPKQLSAIFKGPDGKEFSRMYDTQTDLWQGTLQFDRRLAGFETMVRASEGREQWEATMRDGGVVREFTAPYEGPLPPTEGWTSTEGDSQLEIEWPSDKPPPLRTGYIQNKKTGLVWDIVGANKAKGARVQMYSKNGNANQLWSLTDQGKLKSHLNNKVIGIGGYKKNRGQWIVTWDDGGADKFWDITEQGHLQSKWCGLVVGIAEGTPKQGGKLVTWSKDGNWDKLWKFEPHPKA